MSIAILAIVVNWILILFTQNKFRKSIGQEGVKKLEFRMPFYPYSNYITLAYLFLIVILMGFMESMRISLYLAPVWIGVLFISYKIKNAAVKKNNK